MLLMAKHGVAGVSTGIPGSIRRKFLPNLTHLESNRERAQGMDTTARVSLHGQQAEASTSASSTMGKHGRVVTASTSPVIGDS